jgi:2-keto-3-deoxy-L-rhamnonate aldolase RhmA
MGIIVPHVDTAAQAKRIADAFHYPPSGTRSWGGPPALYAYQAPDVGLAQREINDEILTTVMIESPEAVRNASEIAAVPGIDVLLFGSFDLTTELGIPGQMGHQKLIDAYQTVGDACRKHGKILGMGGINNNEDARRFVAMGCRYVLTGSDHSYVIAGAQAKADFMRGLVNR